MEQPQYKRILLKLSGEALMREAGYGIDPQMLETFAAEVETISQLGVQIGIVIGGGNIYRGIQAAAEGIHKVTGDHMGLLATVINAVAMQSALENREIKTRLQTAIVMKQIAEPFIRRRAVRHLENGDRDSHRFAQVCASGRAGLRGESVGGRHSLSSSRAPRWWPLGLSLGC